MNDLLTNVVKPLNCQADDMAVEWEAWKGEIEMIFDVKDVTIEDKKKKLLLLLGGRDFQKICANLPEHDPDESYTALIARLDSFFSLRRSKRYERHVFRKIKQRENERFDQFVMRLRIQAAKCEWTLMQVNDNIVDQVVEGCISEKLRLKIMEKDLDLEELTVAANTLEALKEQNSLFNKETKSEASVNWVPPPKRWDPASICSKCGWRGHIAGSDTCPAKDRTCRNCNQPGHFRKCCPRTLKRKAEQENFSPYNKRHKWEQPKKQGSNIHQVDERDEAEEDDEEPKYAFHLGAMDKVPCVIGGVRLDLIVDSGASVNTIGQADWECLKKGNVKVIRQTKGSNKKLTAYGSDQPLTILGVFQALVKVGHSESIEEFYVIENGKHSLMGNKLAKSSGILRIDLSINQVKKEEPGKFPKLKGICVKLNINEDVTPVFQPYRRIPEALETKVSEKLAELERKGIIERVIGHAKWASPLVVVPKANGDIRLCVDMRRANKAIVVENFPFPTLEDLTVSVDPPRNEELLWLSKIDIKDAYFGVNLDKESRYITTFITKGTEN